MHMLNRKMLRARRQRGLSIIEFMVGIAVGLFVVGGAAKLLVDNLTNNRKLLVETRVNQDLRSAADLIARDLRRAGYWRNATNVVSGATVTNPYAGVVNTTTDLTTGELTYTYDRDGNSFPDNGDRSGFKVDGGMLQMQNGANGWQPVTDASSMEIVSPATLAVTTKTVELSASCPCLTTLTCTPALFLPGGSHYATRPLVTVREYDLTLTGRAPSDTNVRRTIRETVRLRNDAPSGTCPP